MNSLIKKSIKAISKDNRDSIFQNLGIRENLVATKKEYVTQHYVDLYLNGNAEVKMGTTTILNDQEFKLTENEIKRVKDLLHKFNYSLDGFKISYEIID